MSESARTAAPIARRALVVDLAGLALGAGLLFLAALGARDLWAPNEPIYGRAVVEMAERGDWLMPTINGLPFAEKPILYYWAALASSQAMGGVDESSLRMPSALAGIATVLLTYLLVLPYAGRRRALLAAAILATQYQVFWAARSVQMDILVLVSTLAAVLPVTRMLDFGMRPGRAWALAGLAAGLGFAAKGPVAVILPGLVVFVYAITTKRLPTLFDRRLLLGLASFAVVASPWYVALWLRGESAALFEVLVRQNLGRFVHAWDHDQPWWYYAQYVVTDYAPWSFLLPAAWLARRKGREERVAPSTAGRLEGLAWLWIVAIVVFFSLSDSKRAPYILPIAPAVAILAAGVVERQLVGGALNRGARRAAQIAMAALCVVFLAAALTLILHPSGIPTTLLPTAQTTALLLTAIGTALGASLVITQRRPIAAPATLLLGVLAVYLFAAVRVMPAIDPLKSARSFADGLQRELVETGGAVVSYGLWDWRAGYAYYAGRSIPNLHETAAVESFWRGDGARYVLVESRHEHEIAATLHDAVPIHRQRIGSRTAVLFRKAQAPIVVARGTR